MTSEGPWLIDKSAYVRLGRASRAERIERGLVHVATATILEVGTRLAPATAGLR